MRPGHRPKKKLVRLREASASRLGLSLRQLLTCAEQPDPDSHTTLDAFLEAFYVFCHENPVGLPLLPDAAREAKSLKDGKRVHFFPRFESIVVLEEDRDTPIVSMTAVYIYGWTSDKHLPEPMCAGKLPTSSLDQLLVKFQQQRSETPFGVSGEVPLPHRLKMALENMIKGILDPNFQAQLDEKLAKSRANPPLDIGLSQPQYHKKRTGNKPDDSFDDVLKVANGFVMFRLFLRLVFDRLSSSNRHSSDDVSDPYQYGPRQADPSSSQASNGAFDDSGFLPPASAENRGPEFYTGQHALTIAFFLGFVTQNIVAELKNKRQGGAHKFDLLAPVLLRLAVLSEDISSNRYSSEFAEQLLECMYQLNEEMGTDIQSFARFLYKNHKLPTLPAQLELDNNGQGVRDPSGVSAYTLPQFGRVTSQIANSNFAPAVLTHDSVARLSEDTKQALGWYSLLPDLTSAPSTLSEDVTIRLLSQFSGYLFTKSRLLVAPCDVIPRLPDFDMQASERLIAEVVLFEAHSDRFIKTLQATHGQSTSTIIVDYRSQRLLVRWIATCLHYTKVCNDDPFFLNYSLPLDPRQLQSLSFSGALAIEAVQNVLCFLNHHSTYGTGIRRPPFFSHLKADVTKSLALAYAKKDDTMMDIWRMEQQVAQMVKDAEWIRIQKKQKLVISLRAELAQLEANQKIAQSEYNTANWHVQCHHVPASKRHESATEFLARNNAQTEMTRLEGIRSAKNSALSAAQSLVDAKKAQIEKEKRPGPRKEQRLPLDSDDALRVIFFLFSPSHVRLLQDSIFIAQHMIAPDFPCPFPMDSQDTNMLDHWNKVGTRPSYEAVQTPILGLMSREPPQPSYPNDVTEIKSADDVVYHLKCTTNIINHPWFRGLAWNRAPINPFRFSTDNSPSEQDAQLTDIWTVRCAPFQYAFNMTELPGPSRGVQTIAAPRLRPDFLLTPQQYHAFASVRENPHLLFQSICKVLRENLLPLKQPIVQTLLLFSFAQLGKISLPAQEQSSSPQPDMYLNALEWKRHLFNPEMLDTLLREIAKVINEYRSKPRDLEVFTVLACLTAFLRQFDASSSNVRLHSADPSTVSVSPASYKAGNADTLDDGPSDLVSALASLNMTPLPEPLDQQAASSSSTSNEVSVSLHTASLLPTSYDENPKTPKTSETPSQQPQKPQKPQPLRFLPLLLSAPVPLDATKHARVRQIEPTWQIAGSKRAPSAAALVADIVTVLGAFAEDFDKQKQDLSNRASKDTRHMLSLKEMEHMCYLASLAAFSFDSPLSVAEIERLSIINAYITLTNIFCPHGQTKDSSNDAFRKEWTIKAKVMLSQRIFEISDCVASNPQILDRLLYEVNSLPIPTHPRNWISPMSSTREGYSKHIWQAIEGRNIFSVNLLNGSVLVNERSPGLLPRTITEHPLYKRHFGDRNFEVSEGLKLDSFGPYFSPQHDIFETLLPISGFFYRFQHVQGGAHGHLVVEEIPEFDPSRLTSGTGYKLFLVTDSMLNLQTSQLPQSLRDKFSLWHCPDEKFFVFRPIAFIDRQVEVIVVESFPVPVKKLPNGFSESDVSNYHSAGASPSSSSAPRPGPVLSQFASDCVSNESRLKLLRSGTPVCFLVPDLDKHKQIPQLLTAARSLEYSDVILCAPEHARNLQGDRKKNKAIFAEGGKDRERHTILAMLSKFEHPAYINLVLCLETGKIVYSFLRYHIDFELRNGYLHSLQHEGYVLCQNQLLSGSLQGFRSYLLLEKLSTVLRRGRPAKFEDIPGDLKMLVPDGYLRVHTKGNVTVEPFSALSADIPGSYHLFHHYTYDFDNRLMRWRAPDIPSRMFLAALFCVTSNMFPDDHSKLTGEEMALALLRQCFTDEPYSGDTLRNIELLLTHCSVRTPALLILASYYRLESLKQQWTRKGSASQGDGKYYSYAEAAASSVSEEIDIESDFGLAKTTQRTVKIPSALSVGEEGERLVLYITNYMQYRILPHSNIHRRLTRDEEEKYLQLHDGWFAPLRKVTLNYTKKNVSNWYTHNQRELAHETQAAKTLRENAEQSIDSLIGTPRTVEASKIPRIPAPPDSSSMMKRVYGELDESIAAYEQLLPESPVILTPEPVYIPLNTLYSKNKHAPSPSRLPMAPQVPPKKRVVLDRVQPLLERVTNAMHSLQHTIELNASKIPERETCWFSLGYDQLTRAFLACQPSMYDLVTALWKPEHWPILNPFLALSIPAIQNIRKATIEWMQLAVLLDKLHALFALCQGYDQAPESFQEEVIKLLPLKRPWNVYEHPYWLAFEMENRLQIRPEQYITAMNDLEPGNISQLNMGQGKTRAITPMMLMELSLGLVRSSTAIERRELLRLTMLPQLLREGYGALHQLLTAGIANIKLFTLPFHRDVQLISPSSDKTAMDHVYLLKQHLRFIQSSGGVLITTANARNSMVLKIEEIAAKHGAPGIALRGELLKTLHDTNFRDIVDETDEVFKHTFQLIYSVGTEVPLPSADARMTAIMAVMLALQHSPFVRRLLNIADLPPNPCYRQEEEEVPRERDRDRTQFDVYDRQRNENTDARSKAAFVRQHRFGSSIFFNELRLLPGEYLKKIQGKLVNAIILHMMQHPLYEMCGWFDTIGGGVPTVSYEQLDSDLKHHPIFQYILDIDTQPDRILTSTDLVSAFNRDIMLTLRGLLGSGLLLHSLQSRHHIKYGLPLPLSRNKEFAIPYLACGIPSERSEFSHPDVVLLFTMLSYFYSGLRDDQLLQSLNLLLTLPEHQQTAIYEEWLEGADPMFVDEAERALVSSVAKLDTKSLRQLEILTRVFSHNMRTIFFFLIRIRLPKDSIQFPRKGVTSAFHVADPFRRKPASGFSGTNVFHHLLPLGVKQYFFQKMKNGTELTYANGTPVPKELKQVVKRIVATNGEMVHLLNEKATVWMEPIDDSRTLLNFCLRHGHQSLIDAGGLLGELSNADAAIFVRSRLCAPDSTSKLKGVVYFGPHAYGPDNWLVLDKKGRIMLHSSSPIKEHECFVIFDQQRCRGADMKLLHTSSAVLTLGAKLDKDAFMQAFGRMRKLRLGQTVRIVAQSDILPLVVAAGERRRAQEQQLQAQPSSSAPKKPIPGNAQKYLASSSSSSPSPSRLSPPVRAPAVLTPIDVIAWTMENTANTYNRGIIEWAVRAVEWLKSKHVLSPGGHDWPEKLSLEELYAQPPLTGTLSERIDQKIQEVLGKNWRHDKTQNSGYAQQIMDRVTQFDVETLAKTDDSHWDEENLREVAQEQERQEQRDEELATQQPAIESDWASYEVVLRHDPMASIISQANATPLEDFVRRKLAVAKLVDFSLGMQIYVSKNFMTTVDGDLRPRDFIKYLRPVEFVLQVNTGFLLIVSRREANRLCQVLSNHHPSSPVRLFPLSFARLLSHNWYSHDCIVTTGAIPLQVPAISRIPLPDELFIPVALFTGLTHYGVIERISGADVREHVIDLALPESDRDSVFDIVRGRGLVRDIGRSDLDTLVRRPSCKRNQASSSSSQQ